MQAVHQEQAADEVVVGEAAHERRSVLVERLPGELDDAPEAGAVELRDEPHQLDGLVEGARFEPRLQLVEQALDVVADGAHVDRPVHVAASLPGSGGSAEFRVVEHRG